MKSHPSNQSSSKNYPFSPANLTRRTALSSNLVKCITTTVYDQFGNKRLINEKEKQIMDMIETTNIEQDISYLKEHQRKLGLVTLAHLDFFKKSKARKGQLDHFTLFKENEVKGGGDQHHKLKIEDIKNRIEQDAFNNQRLNDYFDRLHLKNLVAACKFLNL